MLDLRDGVGPSEWTLEDLVWVLIRGFAGVLRLDLRAMFPRPEVVSGDLSSILPFDTIRVWLLGEALLIESLRCKTPSFSGEGARGGLGAAYSL